MIYPFVRARNDYGPRKGTLGLMLHMAEGFNTVQYLANDPRLGNSANYVCEVNGQIVRMLPWDNTSGSLNPRDRTGDSVYYGHSHLVDVLGDHWPDPNPWVISMEIEGFRATGPNKAQQESIVNWAADMVTRYPTIRGALGHHDQSPKGCPGTTNTMRAIFASIGGHGLWPQEEPDMPGLVVVGLEPFAGIATVKGDGHSAIQMATGNLVGLPNGATKVIAFKGRLTAPFNADHPDTTVYGCGDEAAVLLAEDVVVVAIPPVNCDDKVAAQREKDRAAVLQAVEEVYAA